MDSEIARLFTACSAKELREGLSKIEVCVAKLSDDQIWSRGAPHENSIGNLILHLCGNVRQWIGAGVGREQDIRNRESEFSTRGGLTAAELVAVLRRTVEQAVAILTTVSLERLAEQINPQDGPVPVLNAIYRVVGHFQLHAGQILFATKIYTGEDLGLYRPKSASQ